MTIKINRDTFAEFLNSTSYSAHGDDYERQIGQVIIDVFPNAEVFWRKFVVPATMRISGYPKAPLENIRIRQNVNSMVQDISITHYSLFLNIFYTHNHISGEKVISFVENSYAHLGTSCDLAEMFLEKVYFLLLKCRNEETYTLQGMTKDDFLRIAGEWYDKYYAKTYEHYLSKGKSPRISLPARSPEILREFFQYLNRPDLWKRYSETSRVIREFRNVVVHDVQVARGVAIGHPDFLIPRPSLIQKYRSWKEFFTGIEDFEQVKRDFVFATPQILSDTQTLKLILNDIWAVVIAHLEEEFYHPQRTTLRAMYDLDLE